MTRRVAVLRPEPGNAATIARLRDVGLTAISLPLFEVAALPWTPPSITAFDGLILTSANALRHGGEELAALHGLPVTAVGTATAAAARARGFSIERTGDRDLQTLLADVPPHRRLLWLCGEARTAIDHPAIALAVPVYRAVALPVDPAAIAMLDNSVALLHSSRAAARLATVIDRTGIARAGMRLATISAKVANAAGIGWGEVAVADLPNDDALIATAGMLAIDP